MIRSTLINFKGDTVGRATGNTTRMVDHAIQMIFDEGGCIVKDPWDNGTHHVANKDLMHRILRRLSIEHNFDYYMDLGIVTIDKNKLEIRFSKEKWEKNR